MTKKIVIIIFIILIFLTMSSGVSARKHEVDLGSLSDYYSVNNSCNSKSEDCKKGPEYRFYLKMYDLYYLYLSKYNVKLDLPLIMSTLFYNRDQLNEVFKLNLSDYERETIVESDWNPKETTSLDWDYDYESKDNYLVSNDFSMDMQVLAKNMVTKTTVQKCIKDGAVVKTASVKDSEEDLTCNSGETLEKGSATYQLDLDKYDEFLLEYIEKKYFLGRKTANPVISNGPDYVSDKYPSVRTKTKSKTDSTSSSDVIDKLIKIGLAEEGNNGTKYENWYNMYGDWCAMFVSWLFDQVGGLDKYIVKSAGAGTIPRCSSKEGSSSGECSKVVDLGTWYESEYTDSSTVPRAGDVVVFVWGAQGRYDGYDQYYSDHVGFVYKVDDNNIYTIEGNTGSDDFNSSVVGLKTYDRKSENINGYFRPYYESSDSSLDSVNSDDPLSPSTLLTTEGGFKGKIHYYNQGNYSDYSFGGYGSIQSHGCGSTSLAIVISSLLDRDHDPIEVTNKLCSLGGCTDSGATLSGITDTAKAYGLNVDYNSNTQDVVNALSSGNALVVAITNGGLIISDGVQLSNGGHYIVLTGVTSDGRIKIADPGNSANNSRTLDIEALSRNSNNRPESPSFWIITK